MRHITITVFGCGTMKNTSLMSFWDVSYNFFIIYDLAGTTKGEEWFGVV